MKPRLVLIGEGFPLLSVLDRAPQSVEICAVYFSGKSSESLIERRNSRGFSLSSVLSLRRMPGLKRLQKMAPDWILNVYSTFILPNKILKIPKKGTLNFHPGRLPEYAGIHCHQWAIRNGEKEFGCAVHWVTPQLDAGDIAFQHTFPISSNDTGLSLFKRTLDHGVSLMIQTLEAIGSKKEIPAHPQDLTKRHLYRKKDTGSGEIDWSLSDMQILNFIRAADYSPLKSPSYQSKTCYRKRTVGIRKATLGGKAKAPEGTILAINEKGIQVATGKGGSIWVTEILWGRNEIISGEDLSEKTSIQAGGSFD